MPCDHLQSVLVLPRLGGLLVTGVLVVATPVTAGNDDPTPAVPDVDALAAVADRPVLDVTLGLWFPRLEGIVDIGPDGTFVPAQVLRCSDSWRIGAFSITLDTPGSENFVCDANFVRCYATSFNPINQGILAIEGPGSLQLNNSSVFAYELPVDSFGVMIAGLTDMPASTPFGEACITSSQIRIGYGFASGGELTFPIDLEAAVYAPLGTGGSGFAVGDTLAFQYLYRDNSAPSGARFTDATAFTITP